MPTNVLSLLNGSGDRRSVHSGAAARAQDALPDSSSPSQSRASSAQGSYSTGDTVFEERSEESAMVKEEIRHDHAAGNDSERQQRDGKGNVIVSVRVRPDPGGIDKSRTDCEWMVDGRRSLVAYRGREGGDYFYGLPPCLFRPWLPEHSDLIF